MTEANDQHKVDVGIQALVMTAARLRLNALREQERAKHGAPRTSLSDVGRSILRKWRPKMTAPEIRDGVPHDEAGNVLNERGHREFVGPDEPVLGVRPEGQAEQARARDIVARLLEIVEDSDRLSLPRLNELTAIVKAEGLTMCVVDGVTLDKHLGAARRALLKPFRFTMPEEVYQEIYRRAQRNKMTITRILELGLEKFAQTGTY